MPKVVDVPKTLKPYVFHGLDVQGDGEQRRADCPWCGREGKLGITASTGLWRCYVCNQGSEESGKDFRGGNALVFLRMLHERSAAETHDLSALVTHRRLLDQGTLRGWGVVTSVLTGDCLVPGYSADGKLCQLYKYVEDWEKPGRWTLFPTPDVGGHGLHMPADYDRAAGTVYVCEGPWDGMALREMLRRAKRGPDGKLGLTGAPGASLGASAEVVALPGCGSVGEPMRRWTGLLAGKRVVLCFDSDHPRQHAGALLEPAGYAAMKRACRVLAEAEVPPAEIQYLHWGDDGYDPALKSGVDVRDLLTAEASPSARVQALGKLLARVRPIREEWLGEGRRATPGHVGEIESLPCDSYEKLVKAWRKAMRWGPELDGFLTISLASVMSVDRVGHGQLWFKAIGPPSCGKSTIAEAFAVNKNHVIARSTFGNTGIVSAYQVDKEGTEDKSLMEKIKGKLLFVKDGDTLLKAANRDKILSQLRDAFDKVIRTTAGNEMSRDYEGYAFCVGICGTKMLRELDTSELGQRFIDYVIFDEINEDDEDAVGWNVANQSSMEMAYKYDGKMESQDSPEKVLAKRLTAGYIDHLRATNDEVFSRMDMAEPDLRYAQTLAKFTAFMRARPNDNKKVEGEAGRELSYRLIAQFVRLAKSIAGVWNKHFVDDEVMHLVRKVALDTSRGKTLEMVRHLYREGQQGFFPEGLASWTQDDTETTTKLLRFLRRIKAVETWVKPTPGVKKPRPRWRLTERMRALYHAVMGDEAHA